MFVLEPVYITCYLEMEHEKLKPNLCLPWIGRKTDLNNYWYNTVFVHVSPLSLF